MSLDLAAIATGLQTNLATIDDLQVYDVAPDAIVAPAIIPRPILGKYHQTRGSDISQALSRINYELFLLVAPAQNGLENGVRLLLPYLGTSDTTKSIAIALESDRFLGGAAGGLMVDGWRDIDTYQWAGIEWVGCIFDVVIDA